MYLSQQAGTGFAFPVQPLDFERSARVQHQLHVSLLQAYCSVAFMGFLSEYCLHIGLPGKAINVMEGKRIISYRVTLCSFPECCPNPAPSEDYSKFPWSSELDCGYPQTSSHREPQPAPCLSVEKLTWVSTGGDCVHTTPLGYVPSCFKRKQDKLVS